MERKFKIGDKVEVIQINQACTIVKVKKGMKGEVIDYYNNDNVVIINGEDYILSDNQLKKVENIKKDSMNMLYELLDNQPLVTTIIPNIGITSEECIKAIDSYYLKKSLIKSAEEIREIQRKTKETNVKLLKEIGQKIENRAKDNKDYLLLTNIGYDICDNTFIIHELSKLKYKIYTKDRNCLVIWSKREPSGWFQLA